MGKFVKIIKNWDALPTRHLLVYGPDRSSTFSKRNKTRRIGDIRNAMKLAAKKAVEMGLRTFTVESVSRSGRVTRKTVKVKKNRR